MTNITKPSDFKDKHYLIRLAADKAFWARLLVKFCLTKLFFGMFHNILIFICSVKCCYRVYCNNVLNKSTPV